MAVSPADWARIEELLPRALDLPPAERSAFLRRECQGAPALLGELEALVAAAAETGDLLRPIGLSAAAAETGALPAGTVLGAWRIGEPIGHGGMGQVYAAERADGQFEMPAALKVLKRGLDTDALLRRFLRERAILARLSHPNIARLLDAGATADGRPYFVMERVHGEPITDWCRARGTGVNEILRLVLQVCHAVNAAHRERIVHRDLKPSNLLVSATGEIKLLDFGIAKALAEDDAGYTQTAMEARLLTPSYAAPEQILGQPVSAATDVYALGVLLFELLTGQRPHRREGVPLQLLTAELHRETTTRPSLALQRATANLPAEPQRRAHELAGDVDHIVLKALHADPGRRYASALDLAEDLNRFLEHRPVLARPDSMGYRAGRFVRRHPVPVAAGGIASLALVTGFAVALWQAGVARAEARRAADNLATAQAVSAFVTQDLLASVDPDRRSTANITLKEMLDIAAGQVDKRFADQPEVAAQLHHALGRSYGGIGQHAEKRAHEARAAQLFGALHGGGSVPALQARFEEGVAVKRLGDLPAALAIQDEVYRGWVGRGEAEHPQALVARLERASLQEALSGDLAVAIAEAQAVLEAQQRTGAPEDDVRLATMILADLLKTSADYPEAERLYRQLLESLERSPAARYLMHPRMKASLADVLIVRGRYDEAERALAALREELVALVPPNHDQFLILNLRYARLRTEQARFEEAEAYARPLLESTSVLWPLTARVVLAEIEMRSGRTPEAVRTANRLMTDLKDLIPTDDSSFVEVSALQGEALTLAGRLAEAREALDVARDALPNTPPRHPMLALYRRAEGLLWLAQDRPETARPALAEALSIYESRLGPDHWRTRRARDELARSGPVAGAAP